MIQTSQIQTHMEVVGSDGKHLGKVDHVLGDEIELSRAMAIGPHHAIPLTWVATVDDKVHLSLTEDEAKAGWREIH